MAEIYGKTMTDEMFMLAMELGTILQNEGYDTSSGKDIDPSKVKSERAHAIMKRLQELSESNDKKS